MSPPDNTGAINIKALTNWLEIDASIFMDSNECNTVIAAARDASGKSTKQILQSLNEASAEFGKAAKEKFGNKGEW